MTRTGIEPQSLRPLANTLPVKPICMYIYIYTHTYTYCDDCQMNDVLPQVSPYGNTEMPTVILVGRSPNNLF